MQILYDGLAMQSGGSRHRGIGRYSANLLAALKQARPNWQIHVVMHADLPALDSSQTADLPIRLFHPPLPLNNGTREVVEKYYADWLTAQAPDWVVHASLFEFAGAVPRYGDARPKTAAVLYDLIPLLFPDTYLTTRAVAPEDYALRVRALAKLDLLLSISRSSAEDAVRLLEIDPDKVTNIRGSSDPLFSPLPAHKVSAAVRAVGQRYGLTKPYILYVGGNDYRKNMEGSIDGYAALPEVVRREFDLVLACHFPEHRLRELEGYAASRGVGGTVRLTGMVPDDDLVALYHGCRVFFFPSFYEGLGLPVVEAMRCGAPVVAASNSSLPEYAGPVSRYCDPSSPASMADALLLALSEPKEARLAERAEFVRGFGWQDTAERAAQALEQSSTIPAIPRKPRLAWVSPAPPTATGIADYAVDVAAALSERYELEWVIDPAADPTDPAVARRYRMFTADEIGARHAACPFDLFVYHVGNNHFHSYMLPLMRRHPGLSVIHDVYLGILFRFARDAGVWPGSWEDELLSNGDFQAAEWVRGRNVEAWTVPAYSPLHRRVFESADAFVVHSNWAWQQVRKGTDGPVAVVPHIAPPIPAIDRAAERARLGMPTDRFVVCTLGHVGPPKRIPALIRATATLPDDVRDRTSILVVGPIAASDRESLIRLAEELGIAGQVEVRGRVPIEDFPRYAAAADVCVQLRFPSLGETSGALTRSLAAGACCVTSDGGTMAELPNAVTMKVRSPLLDEPDLTRALTRLARDPELRDRLGANARTHMAETHGPAVIAGKYAAAIENAIAARDARDGRWMADTLNALTELPGELANELLDRWAQVRSRVRPSPTTESLPELPDVPAEKVPGKQAA